jgi:hypothetical protein
MGLVLIVNFLMLNVMSFELESMLWDQNKLLRG